MLCTWLPGNYCNNSRMIPVFYLHTVPKTNKTSPYYHVTCFVRADITMLYCMRDRTYILHILSVIHIWYDLDGSQIKNHVHADMRCWYHQPLFCVLPDLAFFQKVETCVISHNMLPTFCRHHCPNYHAKFSWLRHGFDTAEIVGSILIPCILCDSRSMIPHPHAFFTSVVP